MAATFKTYIGWTFRAVAALAVGLVPVSVANGAMPVAQQNALVQRYCAVCHNDAHVNGGLTLEHFDSAHADPNVAAMLLSKLTNGLALERVSRANTDPAAAATIIPKTSAIHAAGVPAPDSATSLAWVMALSAEAARATEWTVNQVQNPASQVQVLTASVIREVTANDPARADMYRLTVTCKIDTREGEILLAWAPGAPAKDNIMSVVIDGKVPSAYQVEGSEKMFKGTFGTMGTGATILNAKMGSSGMLKLAMPLPEQTLAISNLFRDETVVFPFGNLTQTVRQALSTCFTGSSASQ